MREITIKEYLEFWLESGNEIFFVKARKAENDEITMTIAPSIAVNANSTMGHWDFGFREEALVRIGEYFPLEEGQ